MTNFTEQSVFTEGVRMIEPGDSVIGGVNAPINLPFQALANRTLWLKTELAKPPAQHRPLGLHQNLKPSEKDKS